MLKTTLVPLHAPAHRQTGPGQGLSTDQRVDAKGSDEEHGKGGGHQVIQDVLAVTCCDHPTLEDGSTKFMVIHLIQFCGWFSSQD